MNRGDENYDTTGKGEFVFFNVDENQLKLSLGDDYHLYGRKASD
jgi:hypothetical protein